MGKEVSVTGQDWQTCGMIAVTWEGSEVSLPKATRFYNILRAVTGKLSFLPVPR